MFAFKFKVRMKKWSCKNKTVQQTNSYCISFNQLFKVLSTGTNTCSQPWPPLINGLAFSMTLCLNSLSPDRN